MAMATATTSRVTLRQTVTHKLFVYGTLKRGFYNHDVYLKPAEQYGSAKYLGLAQTQDPFALKVLGPRCIPALLEEDEVLRGQNDKTYQQKLYKVEGEVYEIADSVLDAMDILEGVADGIYYRARKPVIYLETPPPITTTDNHGDGSIIIMPESCFDCWVYLQKPPKENPSSDDKDQSTRGGRGGGRETQYQPTYPVYTKELHNSYVPPTTIPNPQILELLRQPGDS